MNMTRIFLSVLAVGMLAVSDAAAPPASVASPLVGDGEMASDEGRMANPAGARIPSRTDERGNPFPRVAGKDSRRRGDEIGISSQLVSSADHEHGRASPGDAAPRPIPVAVFDATRFGGRKEPVFDNLADLGIPLDQETRIYGRVGSSEVRRETGTVAEGEYGPVTVYNAAQADGWVYGCMGSSPSNAWGDQMGLQGVPSGGTELRSYSFAFYPALGAAFGYCDWGSSCYPCYDGVEPYTVESELYDGPPPGCGAGQPIAGTYFSYSTTAAWVTGSGRQYVTVELDPKVFVPEEVWLSVMIGIHDHHLVIGMPPDVGTSPLNAFHDVRLCEGGAAHGQVCWPDQGDYETCLGNICQDGFQPGIPCNPLGGDKCEAEFGTCPPGKGTCDDFPDAWSCPTGPISGCPGCDGVMASATGNASMIVSLVPVEAHVKPGDIKSAEVGTITPEGDEIILSKGGANVWLEIRVGDWTASGLELGAWTVTIDQAGFSSGLEGTLTLKSPPCDNANPEMGDSDCVQALGPGNTLEAPPPVNCILPTGAAKPYRCAPIFIDPNRPDYISPNGLYWVNPVALIPGSTQAPGTETPPSTCQLAICVGGSEDGITCDRKDPADQCVPGGGVCPEYVCRIDFDCWALTFPNACNQPFPSGGLYGGTLVVEVPPDAKGTFTIDFVPKRVDFVQPNAKAIPLVSTIPVKITVQTGRCCFGIGVKDKKGGCIDDLTQNQCNEAGNCKGYCEDDPAIHCYSDYTCVRDGALGPCVGGATIGRLCLVSGDKGRTCDYAAGEDCVIQQKKYPIDPTLRCPDPYTGEPACPYCVWKEDCADGYACTIDQCVAPGVCSYVKVVKDPAKECCDPNTTVGSPEDILGLGAITNMDDNNMCTNDSCSKGTNRGIPVNVPEPAGMKCWDDKKPEFTNKCVYTGFCDGAGWCEPQNVNDVPCIDASECTVAANPQFTQDYACDGGFCVCCKTDADCDDNVGCTNDSCVNNDCVHDPEPAGMKCWDEKNPEFTNKCVYTGYCDAAGVCQPEYVYDVPCNSDIECSLFLNPQFTQDYTCDLVNKVCTCCKPSTAPVPEMVINTSKEQVVLETDRYLSFAVGDPGITQSIMVKFTNLPGPYSLFNGNCMWVGTPVQVTESPPNPGSGKPGYADFWAAQLQCDKPAPMDFTTLTGDCVNNVCRHSENAGATCADDSECVRAILHVYGDYIVPSSSAKKAIYEVRVLASDCIPQGDYINDDNYAPPLIMNTSLWGDVSGMYNAPNNEWSAADGQVQVSIDVMAVLSKVAVSPIAPGKARVDVVSTNPKVDLSPDLMVDLPYDLMYVLMAATGQGFPYQSPFGPWPCPEACHGK